MHRSGIAKARPATVRRHAAVRTTKEFSASHALAILHAASARGLDTGQLLVKAGISEAELQSSINRSKLTRLSQMVCEELQDEFFGLTRRPCKPGSFALMCRLMLASPTLEGALADGVQFYNLLTDDLEFKLEPAGNNVRLSITMFDPSLDQDHLLVQHLVILWHRACSWLVGRSLPVAEVAVSWDAPEDLSELPIKINGTWHFNQSWNGLLIPQRCLSMPVQKSMADLGRLLRRSPRPILLRPLNDDSCGSKITQLFVAALREGAELPSFEALAASLAITPKTLQRRLAAEDTSYSRLRENSLKDFAITSLRLKHFSVAAIGEKLGFTETRSFCRAFKKWTGHSPNAFRQLKLEQGV